MCQTIYNPVGYQHKYTDTDITPPFVDVGLDLNVKNNDINMSIPRLFDITNASATDLPCTSSSGIDTCSKEKKLDNKGKVTSVKLTNHEHIDVCTFKLVFKNAASLLDDKDPIKLEAEAKVADLE
ncbi:hypothetical protein Tco_0026178, partial [Tanacetum coccineum]